MQIARSVSLGRSYGHGPLPATVLDRFRFHQYLQEAVNNLLRHQGTSSTPIRFVRGSVLRDICLVPLPEYGLARVDITRYTK
jgi:hypothetical protein